MVFDDGFVEVIKDGHIMKVSRLEAIEEGLFILNKPSIVELPQKIEQKMPFFRNEKPRSFSLQNFKPINRNNVIRSLIDNFHWEIAQARRDKNITRKKLAESIGESEEKLKVIENGGLPSDDFVIISKIENYLGISLRKNKDDFNSARKLLDNKADEKAKEIEKKEDNDLIGNEIEIIE